MILAHKLNDIFSGISIVTFDSNIEPIKEIQTTNFIFFVNEKNEVHSVNVLNSDISDRYFKKTFNALNESKSEEFIHLCLEEFSEGIFNNSPKFVYGKIINRIPHPKSDKLFVLQIIYQKQVFQIVTNTLDSQENRVLVLSLPGSVTANGTYIIPGKMLDVKSEGMLTGYQTLGLKGEGLIFGEEEDQGKDFAF